MSKAKLLIVDDSKVIRERLKLMLRDIECVEVVGEAENYNEAINAMSTVDPDVVMLDISMSGKNGLDLLLQIKLMPNPSTVVMMSNDSDSHYRDLCKKMGADYFFDKTTEFDKIPEMLSAFAKA